MLVGDLEKLATEIFNVEQLGLHWNMDNIGCTRAELDKWRQLSIKLREEMTESKKRNDQESTSIVDAYCYNMKLIKLPKITKKTWCEWYMRWQQEQKYLKDEWAKHQTIKSCLSEDEDIAAGKQLQTSKLLLSHLTRRFGTMDRLIPNLILELQTLSKPRDKRDSKFASNISKITSTLAVVEQEKATTRLECMVVEKIVQTAFPDEIIYVYNDSYLDVMTCFIKQGVDAGTFKKENGQKMFEAADNQDVRLNLLKSFLEKQAALYNMAVPVTQNK